MWRSFLFVPVLEERFLAKAAERGADAVILDLEASIIASRKAEAREALPAAIDRLAAQGQDVVVRVNMLWRNALADLEEAIRPGVKAIVLPGCSSAAQTQAVDAIIAELEDEAGLEPQGVGLIPLIETAAGVVAAAEIAAAAERIVALTFGVEDYLADMETHAHPEFLATAGLSIAHAARAAGKAPLVVPETIADLQQLDAFETAALKGRAMGSVGGFAVHPVQVEILNRVFSPTHEEIEWASRVVAAAEEGAAAGRGAISLDGRMIDLPIERRARKLLARAAALKD
ncbi:MAG: aldolase/citrate lyase family protein [Pseudomonadota bacterium]